MGKSMLPLLDSSLYPQVWQQQTLLNPQALLMAMLTADITPDANTFTRQLLANDTYQDWINSSVFGRYLQRFLSKQKTVSILICLRCFVRN